MIKKILVFITVMAVIVELCLFRLYAIYVTPKTSPRQRIAYACPIISVEFDYWKHSTNIEFQYVEGMEEHDVPTKIRVWGIWPLIEPGSCLCEVEWRNGKWRLLQYDKWIDGEQKVVYVSQHKMKLFGSQATYRDAIIMDDG